MLTLQTKRLLLFALTRDQLEMALHNVPRLAETLQIQVTPEVFSDESRQAMMIKISRMDHADPVVHVWYTYFLLVEAAGRRAVGVCGFKGAPTPFGSVEVGYAMQEDFRNRGYMTEAVRALIEWAFTQEGCRRVTAETLRDNYASQRVLTKAGMALERESQNMLYWVAEKEGGKSNEFEVEE